MRWHLLWVLPVWNDEFIPWWKGKQTHLNWWGRRLQPECLYTSLLEQVGIDGRWEPPWSCRCWSMPSRGYHELYTRQRCLPATWPLSGLAACSWWPASHQRSFTPVAFYINYLTSIVFQQNNHLTFSQIFQRENFNQSFTACNQWNPHPLSL